jgi:hypothetical protein
MNYLKIFLHQLKSTKMKKVFTLFFATVVLMLYAGAANMANGQTNPCKGDPKCIIDSLKNVIVSLNAVITSAGQTIVLKTDTILQAGFTSLPQNPDSIGVVPELDTVLITTDSGTVLATNWQNLTKLKIFDTIFSFMLDANILRNYVISDTTIKYLDVYMGLNNSGFPPKIAILYVPAQQPVPGIDSFVERPFTYRSKPNQQYIFDRCIPCPTCKTAGSSVIVFNNGSRRRKNNMPIKPKNTGH